MQERHVPRNVESRDAQSAAWSRNSNHVFQNDIGLLCRAARVDSLVSDGVYGTIDHAVIILRDLLYGIAFGEVNRDTANLFRSLKAL